MRVLVWILVWIVLVVLAAVYLWGTVRVAWRRARAFGAEVATAEERLSAVQEQVDRLGAANDAIQRLAVFEDPVVVRKERMATRETLRKQRRERRDRDLPTWARHVDSDS